MKRFVIVTTYPEKGTRNIGDQLITQCLRQVIADQCKDACFDIIWRADTWDNVRNACLNADHVFFACLAIRPDMRSVYPFLDKVIDSGVPFSVIASGTDLRVQPNRNLYDGFTGPDLEILKKADSAASVFTTRGRLSQAFCDYLGLEKAGFSGDVAFYGPEFDNLSFKTDMPVRRITVSTPHKEEAYMDALEVLIDGLQAMFPYTNIVLAQHSAGAGYHNFCTRKGIELAEIYKDRDAGLDVYHDADMHVGFRVHGHVSALKRRKYSYLLEQDGRGCDYGLTIEKRISVANYANAGTPRLTPKNCARFFLGRPLVRQEAVSVWPAVQLLSVIKGDIETGFSRFLGLESQIQSFSRSTREAVKAALDTPN